MTPANPTLLTSSITTVCDSLLDEHGQMEALLTSLSSLLGTPCERDPQSLMKLNNLMTTIEEAMNTHFACEESALFPAVEPYHSMILMEAEHEDLVALRSELLALLKNPEPTEKLVAQIKKTGSQFISDMLDHIGRENAGIFPVCERSLSDTEKETVLEGMQHIREAAINTPTPSVKRPERVFFAAKTDLKTPATKPIFSTQLLQLNGLTAKQLIVKAGESLPSHWTAKQGTLVCLQGIGQFIANNETILLDQGTVIAMSPQLTHSIVAESDCHLLLITV